MKTLSEKFRAAANRALAQAEMETSTMRRFRLEYFPTNPQRPSAIWDFATRDGDWWRLVADFSRASVTMEEAKIMCAALNRGDVGDEDGQI